MKNNKKISKNNDNSYYINKSNKNEEIREDIIEGKNGVTEAIKHNRTIEQILVVKGINSVIPIINMAKEKGIVVKEVDKRKLDSLSQTSNHQGVIAIVTPYKYFTVEEILKDAKDKNEEDRKSVV